MYVRWQPLSTALPHSGLGVVNRKIDDQLIRNDDSFYHADVPGIYTLRIVRDVRRPASAVPPAAG